MLLLTSAATDQPDYIALALVVALLLIFVVFYIHKRLASKKSPAEIIPTVVESPPLVAPGSAGTIKTYNVPPKTCAMLMAIVADKLGKPLNELRFISIKEVE